MRVSNSLNQDQARHNVGPELDPNSLNQDQADIMSGRIWIQTVCKGNQQMTLVGCLHLLNTSQKFNTGKYFDHSEINP